MPRIHTRSLLSLLCVSSLAVGAVMIPATSTPSAQSLVAVAHAQPGAHQIADPQQTGSQLTVVGTEAAIYDPRKVDVRATVEVTGFPANTPLKVTVDGVDAVWTFPHMAKNFPTQNTDAAGGLKAVVQPSQPTPHGGSHTITVSTHDGSVSRSIANIDFAAGVVFTSSTLDGKETAVGGTGNLAIGNLPIGTRLVFFGTPGGANWLSPMQQPWVFSPTLPLPVFGVTIPRDRTLVGQPAVVGFQLPGRAVEYQTVIPTLGSDSPSHNNPHFSITQKELPGGLYQTAYSARSDALYVSRSDFAGSSTIYKLDPRTLDVLHERTLDSGISIFGLGVADEAGTVWGTDSVGNQAVVFSQDDLSTVKAFPKESIFHPRDVQVDPRNGKAYISGIQAKSIMVTDQHSEGVVSRISAPGIESTMSLTLLPASRELFTTSYQTPQMMSVNLDSGATTVYDLPEDLKVLSSVAVDPDRRIAYLAAQESGDITVYDLNARRVITRIPTGAGALSAVFEPVNKFVYVANRGTGTVSVIDTATNTVIDNLPVGEKVNHVTTDGKGNVYVANKQSHYLRGEPRDSVFRISYDPNQTFERPVVKTYTPPFISPTVAGFIRGLIGLLNVGGFGHLIPQFLMRFLTI